MTKPSSFEQIIGQLQQADEEAAVAVFERFSGRLLALAAGQLDSQIRPKVDAEDIVQSVFRSFFARCHAGQFQLENWESLWGLLVLITLRKCHRQRRRFHGPVHDVRKEVAADSPGWMALDREPLPEEAAMLTETVEHFLAELNDREQQVLQFRLQGCKVREISEKIDRTEYSVEELLKRIRKKLQQKHEEIAEV